MSGSARRWGESGKWRLTSAHQYRISVVQTGITGEEDATSLIPNAQTSGQLKGFYRVEVSE